MRRRAPLSSEVCVGGCKTIACRDNQDFPRGATVPVFGPVNLIGAEGEIWSGARPVGSIEIAYPATIEMEKHPSVSDKNLSEENN